MGRRVLTVGLVALLVGLVAGYLLWGAPSARLAGELRTVRARLAAAEQAAVREGELESRLQTTEAQLTQVTAQLAGERALRERLEKLVTKPKP